MLENKYFRIATKVGLRVGMNLLVPGSSLFVDAYDVYNAVSQGDKVGIGCGIVSGVLTAATMGVSDVAKETIKGSIEETMKQSTQEAIKDVTQQIAKTTAEQIAKETQKTLIYTAGNAGSMVINGIVTVGTGGLAAPAMAGNFAVQAAINANHMIAKEAIYQTGKAATQQATKDILAAAATQVSKEMAKETAKIATTATVIVGGQSVVCEMINEQND